MAAKPDSTFQVWFTVDAEPQTPINVIPHVWPYLFSQIEICTLAQLQTVAAISPPELGWLQDRKYRATIKPDGTYALDSFPLGDPKYRPLPPGMQHDQEELL